MGRFLVIGVSGRRQAGAHAADVGDTIYDANVGSVAFVNNSWSQVSTIGDNNYVHHRS